MHVSPHNGVSENKKNKNNNGEQYNQSQPCISLLHVKPQTSENKNNGIQKHF
jgi:hypothetical protein